jgi:chromosome partitioning protein
VTQRIAITNQKGGVGKTTVAINLAGGLAKLGHDVLFIDLDPQGNATEGLGLTEAYEPAELTLYDVLVREHDQLDELLIQHEEMTVVPSNVELFNAEPDLITGLRGRERLLMALDRMNYEPEYVLIDCPPWLGVLTDSALLASNSLVIPALAESTSTRAIEILFDQIDTIEENYETTIATEAVVANRVEQDGESEEMVAWFRETFEPAIPVFEIRKRVALKRAWSSGSSIFEHGEACDMEGVFLELAEEIA